MGDGLVDHLLRALLQRLVVEHRVSAVEGGRGVGREGVGAHAVDARPCARRAVGRPGHGRDALRRAVDPDHDDFGGTHDVLLVIPVTDNCASLQ